MPKTKKIQVTLEEGQYHELTRIARTGREEARRTWSGSRSRSVASRRRPSA